MDALTNCLGLGGGEEIYSPSSYFFNNSFPVAQSFRIGHLIHMDGQSVLFCLWGKLKLDLVSISMISILPPPLKSECMLFLEFAQNLSHLHRFFDLIYHYQWMTLEGR